MPNGSGISNEIIERTTLNPTRRRSLINQASKTTERLWWKEANICTLIVAVPNRGGFCTDTVTEIIQTLRPNL